MNKHDEYIKIVERYQAPLYRYCYYRLKENTLWVDQVVNDILTILYKQWDKLDKENIRAYIYRLADNCIKHAWKEDKAYYARHISWEERLETRWVESDEYYDEYFKDERDVEEYLSEVKRRLPEELQQLFEYRYVQRKKINELVELLGIPYSSLRARLQKIEKIVRREVPKIIEENAC